MSIVRAPRFALCVLISLLRAPCTLLFLLALPVQAADWPQWGGSHARNMASDERGIPATFSPGQKRSDGGGVDPATVQNVKWVARLGAYILGNPTVAGGKVFVGTNDYFLDDPKLQATKGGMIQCLDAQTGRRLWKLVIPRYETNDPKFNFDNMDLGVCSSPAVDGNRLYVVSNRCEVLCLDTEGLANGNDGPFVDEGQYSVAEGKPPAAPGADDGDIVWRYDMIRELPCWPQDAASSSPLVYGDFVYVGTSNGVDKSNENVPYPDCPSLIVLDKRSGRLAAYDDEKIGRRLYHGQWSSPSLGVVDGRALVFYGGGDGVCYAFEPLAAAGEKPVPLKRAWRFDCNPPEYRVRDGKPINYRTGDVRRRAGNTNDGTFVGPSEIIATLRRTPNNKGDGK